MFTKYKNKREMVEDILILMFVLTLLSAGFFIGFARGLEYTEQEVFNKVFDSTTNSLRIS